MSSTNPTQALIAAAIDALGYYEGATRTEVERLLTDYPPRLEISHILRMCLVMPRTKNAEKDYGDAKIIEYQATEDMERAIETARNSPGVQRHHLGEELALLIQTITRPGFEPNPMAFDGLMVQYYSVPIVRFVNTSGVEAGYTLFIELNSIRQLVTRSVKDGIDQAIENNTREKVIRALEGRSVSKTGVTVAVVAALLALAVSCRGPIRRMLESSD